VTVALKKKSNAELLAEVEPLSSSGADPSPELTIELAHWWLPA
jgi:hypothetical protein